MTSRKHSLQIEEIGERSISDDNSRALWHNECAAASKISYLPVQRARLSRLSRYVIIVASR